MIVIIFSNTSSPHAGHFTSVLHISSELAHVKYSSKMNFEISKNERSFDTIQQNALIFRKQI